MRKVVGIALLAAVALLPATATGENEAARGTPRLALLSTAPLTVAGSGFRRAERVLVTASAGSARATRRLQASATGRFRASFAVTLAVDRCLGGFVTAFGSRGSRAILKLPQPACPPRL